MTCNRSCDCVGECKAGNEKPTTPTPGDLSARQVIADMQSVAELRTIRHSYIGEKLKGWIAALSALPAAGGVAPVLTAYRCDYCGRDYYDTANCCESRREYLAASTTPQPSAAEDAAVGAQGEAASLILRLTQDADTLEADGDEHGVCQTLDDAAAFLRRLAAPAAGKGVDDAMVERLRDIGGRMGVLCWNVATAEKISGYLFPENYRDTAKDLLCQWREANKAYSAAALTRQPVAGDGWAGEVECCDAKGTWLILNDNCPLVPGQKVIIHAAPAATPTDGGEGS